jgi:hypothetical protein
MRQQQTPLGSSGRPLIIVVSVLAVVALGCSSNKKRATTSTTSTSPGITTATTTAPPPTTTPATTIPSTSAPATAGLTGTWSGQYSGAFQGTFTLTWQQSGSIVSGNIKLSAPPVTLSIKGTVQGDVIKFGTVGSVAITYSGTASGNSMSGTYQVGGAGGGPWSATRSS